MEEHMYKWLLKQLYNWSKSQGNSVFNIAHHTVAAPLTTPLLFDVLPSKSPCNHEQS